MILSNPLESFFLQATVSHTAWMWFTGKIGKFSCVHNKLHIQVMQSKNNFSYHPPNPTVMDPGILHYWGRQFGDFLLPWGVGSAFQGESACRILDLHCPIHVHEEPGLNYITEIQLMGDELRISFLHVIPWEFLLIYFPGRVYLPCTTT